MKDLIVDCFAGGGGASVGIEMALGRPVDIAINHDPDAILMHKTNHPNTLHLTEDIFKVNLKKYVKGRHPLSFVIDEIRPVSRWREFGYSSREAAAQDWNNLQAAHYCCNAMKSNKTLQELEQRQKTQKANILDGNW